MADVKSKNLYELLGNTSDQDSDREPEPPTKAIDKPVARSGKRDAPKEAPAADPIGNVATRGRGGRRGGGFSGSEAAFRDRATGRTYNRDKPTEGEGADGFGNKPGRMEGAAGTRRGGRGGDRPRRGGDRHVNRTGIAEHPKQEGHGWGEATGDGEWADEKAGEAIAKQEEKEGGWDAGANQAWNENAEPVTTAEGGEPVPEGEGEAESNSKSYAEYLAEQAAKKLEGLGLKEARAPNEGAKEDKKWKSAKELTKEQNADYFKGEEKARRERERATKKEFLNIDYTFKEPARESGGRGRGRGGRGRGERGDFGGERRERPDRGDRGDFGGEFRGRGRGRGRGDRGGDRGEFRGRGRGRGASSTDGPGVAVNDESAFPSLGGK
ncbi:hypothetical protein LTR10_023791 [Elasticomyces elasticus]|nr:hypothetical protein LTR10_023791 [Elasticomyces elasticus]KAK5025525.1 hypothetical protein LTR13_010364 [Exophiala sideris]KAK5029797.1 hypothetical protein LTS07_005521 [Exophiala sideris]KAK5178586.1 hypothetical protein LTR44_008957 [Eurotiomycetes sp. CCFEE 6388]